MRALLTISAFVFLFSCTKATYPNMYEAYYSAVGGTQVSKFEYPPIQPPYSKEIFPIRFPEEVLPVWIPDYITEDGILVQGHYIWIVVRKPRWYIQGGPYLPPLEKPEKVMEKGRIIIEQEQKGEKEKK